MENFVKLYDSALLHPIQFTDQNRLYFKDDAGGRPSLITTIAATHAGRLTANNAFYHPMKVQRGMETFTSPYKKPVLKNHDLDSDPLGRVYAARYVDLSAPYASRFQLRDYLISDAKKNIIRLPDPLLQELRNPKFEGLGYIELTANITDKDAIEMIMDERFKTVSVAFVTDAAVCSICGQDWVKDGKCDHIPGQMVDDKPTFIIVGNMRYDEVSFVNRPADNLAGVLEFNRAGILDRVNIPVRAPHEVVFDAFIGGDDTLINVADPKGINLASYTDKFQEVLTLMTVNNSAKADKEVKAFVDKMIADADTAFDVASHAHEHMVIKAHDHIHEKYDWDVNPNDIGNVQVPVGYQKLHADLHKVGIAGNYDTHFKLGHMDHTLATHGIEMPKRAGEEKKDGDAGTGTDMKDKEKDGKKEEAKEEKGEQETKKEEKKEGKKGEKAEEKKEKKEGKEDAEGTEDAEGKDNEENLLDIQELFDEEKCYDLLTAELEAMAVELEDSDKEAAQQFRDAKLSTESRKKLKGSTFCGPNRSFPVPDCAHVTAARRLIGRYQGPGSKEAILACVSRKASSLGCGGGKDAEAPETKKDKAALLAERDALLTQAQAITDELVERFEHQPEPCVECANKDSEIVALKAASVIDLDQLDALELDLQAAYSEVQTLTDQLVEARAHIILDRRQLANKKLMADEEFKTELKSLSSRTLDSLQDTLQDLEKQSPFAKLMEPFTDGMGNNPTGEQVPDPTAAGKDAEDKDALEADEAAMKSQIITIFNRISRFQGAKAAEAYLHDMDKKHPAFKLKGANQI
jgi:hypothetical protein